MTTLIASLPMLDTLHRHGQQINHDGPSTRIKVATSCIRGNLHRLHASESDDKNTIFIQKYIYIFLRFKIFYFKTTSFDINYKHKNHNHVIMWNKLNVRI